MMTKLSSTDPMTVLGEARPLRNVAAIIDAGVAQRARPEEQRDARQPFRGGAGETLVVLEVTAALSTVLVKAVWHRDPAVHRGSPSRTDWVTAYNLRELRAALDAVAGDFFGASDELREILEERKP